MVDAGAVAAAGPYPLEPSAAEMRAMAGRVVESLVEFVEAQPRYPASDLDGALELARSFREPVPEQPGEFEPLVQAALRAASKGFNTTGPGYMAYVPGGGLFTAALADFLAEGLNRFMNLWNPAPVFAQIEATVIRWLADLFEYPPEARGILTTGGSMANFSAIVAARRARLPEEFLDGTLYASEQTHASVAKSAVLAGFPPKNVRAVPCTPDLRIDVGALRELVRADRSAGLQPFCVVANAGTTNTGAVDPLDEVADAARDQGLWLHVDAAYGGPFQMTERGRSRFRGIERADSITLDPHKAMFLPYGTGCLLVREGRRLREAHQVGAEYLQDLAPEGEIPNFADSSPELSREFRGLRIWLPVKLHGLGAFRAALDEKLDLADLLYRGIRDAPGVEVPWGPQLTVVAFRAAPHRRTGQSGRSGGDRFGSDAGREQDERSRRLLERINATRRVFLSSTTIGERFTIRACIVSHRTHRDRIEETIEIVRREAAGLDG